MQLVQVRGGIREGRYQAFGGRFGPGKVHTCLYDSERKGWFLVCRLRDVGWWPYHGERVDVSTPVTCKKCLRG